MEQENPRNKKRVIHLNIGGFDMTLTRELDDPTPDNVVSIGGVYLNLDTGNIGKTIEEVISTSSNPDPRTAPRVEGVPTR